MRLCVLAPFELYLFAHVDAARTGGEDLGGVSKTCLAEVIFSVRQNRGVLGRNVELGTAENLSPSLWPLRRLLVLSGKNALKTQRKVASIVSWAAQGKQDHLTRS